MGGANTTLALTGDKMKEPIKEGNVIRRKIYFWSCQMVLLSVYRPVLLLARIVFFLSDRFVGTLVKNLMLTLLLMLNCPHCSQTHILLKKVLRSLKMSNFKSFLKISH